MLPEIEQTGMQTSPGLASYQACAFEPPSSRLRLWPSAAEATTRRTATLEAGGPAGAARAERVRQATAGSAATAALPVQAPAGPRGRPAQARAEPLARREAPKWVPAEESLRADQLVVLANTADAQSMAIADYYMAARSIPAANRIDLTIPTDSVMKAVDFTTAYAKVKKELPTGAQAFAITWTNPYRGRLHGCHDGIRRGRV